MTIADLGAARHRKEHGEPASPAPSAVPHDRGLEAAMLGCVIQHPPALLWAIEHLAPEAFYNHAYRELYQLVLTLGQAGERIDARTIEAHARRAGIFDEPLGGVTGYFDLIEAPTAVAAFTAYGTQLIGYYTGRRLLDLTRQSQQLVTEAQPGADYTDIAADLARFLEELTEPADPATYTGDTLIGELERYMDASSQDPPGRWGIKALDNFTRGLAAGELTVVGARPGMGKSALATQAAVATAELGRRVLFWSYEMAAGPLAARIVAHRQQIPLKAVLYGTPDTGIRRKIAQGMRDLRDLPLLIDTSGPNIAGLVARTTALHHRDPLGLVVIDYAQLVPAVRAAGRNANREQEVAEVSRAVKQLTLRLHVPVIFCAQLKRDAEGREPTLAALRESGSLEQDADNVLFIHRPDVYDAESPRRGEADLINAKRRMGDTGTVTAFWSGPSTTFISMG